MGLILKWNCFVSYLILIVATARKKLDIGVNYYINTNKVIAYATKII
jgi:hypothetical protein